MKKKRMYKRKILWDRMSVEEMHQVLDWNKKVDLQNAPGQGRSRARFHQKASIEERAEHEAEAEEHIRGLQDQYWDNEIRDAFIKGYLDEAGKKRRKK